jgi:hypothetical protein
LRRPTVLHRSTFSRISLSFGRRDFPGVSPQRLLRRVHSRPPLRDPPPLSQFLSLSFCIPSQWSCTTSFGSSFLCGSNGRQVVVKSRKGRKGGAPRTKRERSYPPFIGEREAQKPPLISPFGCLRQAFVQSSHPYVAGQSLSRTTLHIW